MSQNNGNGSNNPHCEETGIPYLEDTKAMKIFSKLSRKLRKTNSARNTSKVQRTYSNVRIPASSSSKTRYTESLNVYQTTTAAMQTDANEDQGIVPANQALLSMDQSMEDLPSIKEPIITPLPASRDSLNSHAPRNPSQNKLIVHPITLGKKTLSTHKIHPHGISTEECRVNYSLPVEIRSTFHSQSQPQSRKNSSAVLSMFPRISQSFPELLAKIQLIEPTDTLGKLGVLPLEILVLILLHLDLHTIVKTVSQLSRAYNNLMHNDTLWHALLCRDYPNYLDKAKFEVTQYGDVSEDHDPRRKFPVISSKSKTWKDIFMQLYSLRNIGEKVVCHWTKDLFYWGTVERIEEADFYLVEFEDGDKRWALPHHLIRIHYGKPLTIAEPSAENSELPHQDELRPVAQPNLVVNVGSHVIAKFVSKNEAFFCHGIIQRIIDSTTCEVMLPYNQKAVLNIDCLVMTVDNTEHNIHEVTDDSLGQVVACEWNRSVYYIGKISKVMRNEMFYYVRFEDGDASWIHHSELPKIESQRPLTWREIHGRTILAPRFDLERGAYALATITVSCNDKNCKENQSATAESSESDEMSDSENCEQTQQPAANHTCWMHSDAAADLDEDIIFLRNSNPISTK